jgi:hypothetical protein
VCRSLLKTRVCKEILEGIASLNTSKGDIVNSLCRNQVQAKEPWLISQELSRSNKRPELSVENPRNNEDCRIWRGCKVVKGEQAFHSRIHNQRGPLIVICTNRQIISVFQESGDGGDNTLGARLSKTKKSDKWQEPMSYIGSG